MASPAMSMSLSPSTCFVASHRTTHATKPSYSTLLSPPVSLAHSYFDSTLCLSVSLSLSLFHRPLNRRQSPSSVVLLPRPAYLPNTRLRLRQLLQRAASRTNTLICLLRLIATAIAFLTRSSESSPLHSHSHTHIRISIHPYIYCITRPPT